jgi:hypothetical protein
MGSRGIGFVIQHLGQTNSLPDASGCTTTASPRQLRIVSAAVPAAGDLLARVDANSTDHGGGLRGGTFRLKRSGAGARIDLHQVRWTRDVAVSGRILRSSRRHGMVRAFLRVSTPEEPIGRLTVQWPEGVDHSEAQIRGTFGGK